MRGNLSIERRILRYPKAKVLFREPRLKCIRRVLEQRTTPLGVFRVNRSEFVFKGLRDRAREIMQ